MPDEQVQQPKKVPRPVHRDANQPATRATSCAGRCCVGLGRAAFVAFVAAMVQVCLRMAQSAALDGLQCGPQGLRHLSDVPFQGMHVLTANSDGICSSGESEFDVHVHVDGAVTAHGQLPPVVRIPCDSTTRIADTLRSKIRTLVPAARAALHSQLRSSANITAETLEWLGASRSAQDTDDVWERSQFFTPYGTAVSSEDLTQAFQQCGTLYLFQGGTFMWPGISVGHSNIVPIKPQYWLGSAR
jgi:hypothetical protein